MKFLQRLLNFYIQSSIHVGFAVFCLVYITTFSNNLNMDINYPSCVFFGTILGYNFLKYFYVFWNGNFASKKYYSIFIISILSFVGFLFFLLLLKRSIQINLFFSGIAVVVYPFLRKFGWLKLFFVSAVVTYISVFIPYENVIGTRFEFEINCLQRFLILSGLLIPFEIMDSIQDPVSLQTLPQKFGINKSKLFGMLLVIPFIILEFLKFNSSLVSLFIGLVTVILIHFSSVHRNKYYANFWVESVPIFWMVALLFSK